VVSVVSIGAARLLRSLTHSEATTVATTASTSSGGVTQKSEPPSSSPSVGRAASARRAGPGAASR